MSPMSLTQPGDVECPYCGETFEITVDPAEGPRQEWTIDCEICCQPINVRIRIGKKTRIEADRA